MTCSNGNWSEDISGQDIATTSEQFIIPTTHEGVVYCNTVGILVYKNIDNCEKAKPMNSHNIKIILKSIGPKYKHKQSTV